MNAQFVWQEEFNIGVDVIDKEHQRLFKIINKLFSFKEEDKNSQWACKEGVKFFKKFAILKFKGIDHINDIEAYKGGELYVARENAQKLGKDEYFIADLLGVSVVDENGEKLGVLKDVIETGANDVYVVERENKKDLLIPAIKQCIRKVDVEAGEMEVHLMEGLLEE